jgi:hypothetical protein
MALDPDGVIACQIIDVIDPWNDCVGHVIEAREG